MSSRESSRLAWRLTQASARGKSHIEGGLPDQDWVEVMTSQNLEIIAAVICDGAGTARRSELGAQTTCRSLAAAMLELGMQVQQVPVPLEIARQRIVDVIEADAKGTRNARPTERFSLHHGHVPAHWPRRIRGASR